MYIHIDVLSASLGRSRSRPGGSMASKPWRVFVGAALLFGLVATRCSSSSSSSASSPDSTAAPAADLALLGPQKPATGTPLKIGYIYAGQAQNIDNTNEINIAQATVKYLNEHLAGIAG